MDNSLEELEYEYKRLKKSYESMKYGDWFQILTFLNDKIQQEIQKDLVPRAD